jgi:hypothetical protein
MLVEQNFIQTDLEEISILKNTRPATPQVFKNFKIFLITVYYFHFDLFFKYK